jgi:hypothetical protein
MVQTWKLHGCDESIGEAKGSTWRDGARHLSQQNAASFPVWITGYTLIKKKIIFSSYIRKFRVEQLQSHK